jgi:proteasome assembly chaperone (PAC2) family protein
MTYNPIIEHLVQNLQSGKQVERIHPELCPHPKYLNKDGTISFLVNTIETEEAKSVLTKFDIQVLDTEDAVFNAAGGVTDVDFTVRGKREDISFALDSIVKMIRPYPEGFVHKRRA